MDVRGRAADESADVPATIRSQNAWLPITITVSTPIIPGNTPPAQISTQGEYDVAARMQRHVRQLGNAETTRIEADFTGVDCPVHVHRTVAADQELRTHVVIDRSRGAASVPRARLRTERLGRGVSQVVRTGDTAQRVVSVPDAASPRFQAGCARGTQSAGTSMSASMQSGLGGPGRARPSSHPARVPRGRQRRAADCWRR